MICYLVNVYLLDGTLVRTNAFSQRNGERVELVHVVCLDDDCQ